MSRHRPIRHRQQQSVRSFLTMPFMRLAASTAIAKETKHLLVSHGLSSRRIRLKPRTSLTGVSASAVPAPAAIPAAAAKKKKKKNDDENRGHIHVPLRLAARSFTRFWQNDVNALDRLSFHCPGTAKPGPKRRRAFNLCYCVGADTQPANSARRVPQPGRSY